MTLKELAEFLVLIHFSLCLRVFFKNKAASDFRVLAWSAMRPDHRAVSTMVLGQRDAKIGGHQVPAPSLRRTARGFRVLYKLPGFAPLSQGSPAAPMAFPVPKQLCSTTRVIPDVHICLLSPDLLAQFPFILVLFRHSVRHIVKGDNLYQHQCSQVISQHLQLFRVKICTQICYSFHLCLSGHQIFMSVLKRHFQHI